MVDDADLAYEEAAERGAELRQRQKLLDLYYNLAEIIDREPCADDYGIYWRDCLNKFFRDNLNKSL